MFAPNDPLAHKLFWTHPKELIGDMGHVESRFGLLVDIVSVSCAKRTIGSEIILDATNGTPR